ncbi:hypothetical protein C7I55_07205 [Sphingomonas deserti]|uniref:Uncharacterized protein n=1 Tax=Allosphingosinicella deserti TaxID=2116704 RepID=A0A2P7QVR5_9SPHN|nr:hypothetical protein C7I55_07205 [Sphingomonas deserti]
MPASPRSRFWRCPAGRRRHRAARGRGRHECRRSDRVGVHVHAERSCRQPHDPAQAKSDAAASVYFKTDGERPAIQKTTDHYSARKIGFVMFTVACEAGTGIPHGERGDRRLRAGQQRRHARLRVDEAGFKPELRGPILKDDAAGLLF